MKKIRLSFIPLVFAAIFIIALSYLNNKEQAQHLGEEFSDSNLTSYIMCALYSYAEETGDYDFKFGESKTIADVNGILEHLDSVIQIGTEKYGPYINHMNLLNKRSKLRITVYKSNKVIEVNKDDKDSVVILDKSS
ncbi:MAG: hypothetical protein Q8942_13295 [Bacillota bacterium]|nr:hypothetical protein [Bacillota bacterium]